MRPAILAVLAALALAQAGWACGVRVGGNRCGAGIGGYTGPVPDVVKPE